MTRLGPTTDTGELAGMLNAAGLTTGHGRPIDTKAVQWIRHAYHIPVPTSYADGEISVTNAAARLGTSRFSRTRGPHHDVAVIGSDGQHGPHHRYASGGSGNAVEVIDRDESKAADLAKALGGRTTTGEFDAA